VIYLHLLVLLLIIRKRSNGYSSPVEYSQKVLDAIHGMSFMVSFIWEWGNDRSLPLQLSMDRVGVVGCGAWATFIPCVLIKKVNEWQNGGANKGVMYLFDYFDYSLFRFVWIISS
jgi:hypothetical protein